MVETVTVNSRSFDGAIRRSWKCELVEANSKIISLVGNFDQPVDHEHLGTLRKGTISHELFPLDAWYNVFRFHEPGGEFRNFYCNINLPPTFENGVLDYVDLNIDLVVWPDLQYKILDVAEFEANVVNYQYPDSLVSKAYETVAELTTLLRTRSFPFDHSFLCVDPTSKFI